MKSVYRVGEFATRTGVSVRTLHHYDRIGLLCPSEYSQAGYRLYSDQDVLRLQQILTLRYLGFPLKRIAELLQRPDFDLVASMRIQRVVVRARIADLERVDAALGELVDQRQSTGRWSWDLVSRAFQAVHKGLEPKGEKQMNEYYSPDEMQKQFDEIGKRVPQEEIDSIQQRWIVLLTELRANRDLAPDSSEAQALGERWNALQEDTVREYRDNEKLMASIAEGYRQGRYAEIEGAPTLEDFAFIARINAARAQREAGDSSGQ